MLVQLPPSVKQEHQDALEGILECLRDDAPGWKIAVELRHVSWYETPVYRMLESYGATMVEHDLPASKTPPVRFAADFAYLRFHGPDGKYGESYSDGFLADQAARIVRRLDQGKHVYVYFNNTMGDALRNLETLNRMVAALLRT